MFAEGRMEDPARSVQRLLLVALVLCGFWSGVYAKSIYDEVDDALKQLKDPAPIARAMAAKKLGDMGAKAKIVEPEICEILAKSLDDNDKEVQLAVLEAMGKIGSDSKDVGEAIRLMLGSRDEEIRLAGIRVLATIGDAALPVVTDLGKLTLDDNERISLAALSSLAELEEDAEPACPFVIRCLGSDNRSIRIAAARVLPKIVEEEDRGDIIPELMRLLDDKEKSVRMQALGSLATCGKEAQPYLPALRKSRLREESPDVMIAYNEAIQAIEKGVSLQIGRKKRRSRRSRRSRGKSKSATSYGPEVEKHLKDLTSKSTTVRVVALMELGRIGPEVKRVNAKACEAMVEQLGHRDKQVRMAAIEALVRVVPDDEDMAKDIVRLLSEDDPRIVLRTFDLLAAMGEAAAPASSNIARYVNDKDINVAWRACKTLGSIGEPACRSASRHLLRALSRKEGRMRAVVLETMAAVKMPPRTALPKIEAALEDKDKHVRTAAARALAAYGVEARRSLEELQEAREREKDKAVYAVIQESIIRIRTAKEPEEEN